MAVVLAAGHGLRLGGRAKPALQIDGVSVLERLVGALRGGGAEHVHVVVGPYRDKLQALIERCGARELPHTQASPSLIDSQRLAVQAHQAHCPHHDLLLTVADLPLLAREDVLRLLAAWQRREPSMEALFPVVDGVRGHPIVLAASAARQVAAQASGHGVRDWLEQHDPHVQKWVTRCAAYITDVDTPADLEALGVRIGPSRLAWPES